MGQVLVASCAVVRDEHVNGSRLCGAYEQGGYHAFQIL